MKALFINSVCGIRSTGRICTDLAKELEQQGYECKIAYGREEFVPEEFQKYAVRIGNNMDVRLHAFEARLFDNSGFGSKSATKEFLKWADKYNPDLLWLHNLHGYYINVEMLFEWIKSRPNMQVKWTLHDCWAFTGHCTHFSFINCNKWKDVCKTCPQKERYPSSLIFDNCMRNYYRKKELFTGVEDMTIITPSNWLASLVRDSFLKEYKIEVLYNKIDYSIFKPMPNIVKEQLDIRGKYMVLGVASMWDDRKGLLDFIKLSKELDSKYVVVLVGLNKKQIDLLPDNIIGIERTNNLCELVKIYSGSDVFVNLSTEETFGMTTVEAQACGTPAIVYEGTACEEIINKSNGIVVSRSIKEVKKAIEQILR